MSSDPANELGREPNFGDFLALVAEVRRRHPDVDSACGQAFALLERATAVLGSLQAIPTNDDESTEVLRGILDGDIGSHEEMVRRRQAVRLYLRTFGLAERRARRAGRNNQG